jgi:hypothetical protein
LIGPFLAVDLLKAGDVCPQPYDLRPHELDSLGRRRPFIRSGLSKISRLNVAIRPSPIDGLLSRSTLPELNLYSQQIAASNSSSETLSPEQIQSSRQNPSP